MRDSRSDGLFGGARLVTAGTYRRAFFAPDDALQEALRRATGSDHIDLSAGPRGCLQLLRRAPAHLDAGAECLHLLDPGLLLAGRRVARRYGARLSLTAHPGRVPRLLRDGALDQVFLHDTDWMPEGGGRLSIVPPVAGALAPPGQRALARVARLARDGMPGRLVVAAPWPDDRETLLWLRDAVAPLLRGNPLIVLLGAPRGRRGRLLFGAMGRRRAFRLDTRPLDAETLAGAARCADVFLLAGLPSRVERSGLLLAMLASGVPLVVAAGIQSRLLEHERNVLLADPGDRMGLVSTLNQLLPMPAIQRHYLGEEFAARTRTRWSWDAAAAVYADRFAALVGRPPIPSELRAA